MRCLRSRALKHWDDWQGDYADHRMSIVLIEIGEGLEKTSFNLAAISESMHVRNS